MAGAHHLRVGLDVLVWVLALDFLNVLGHVAYLVIA